MSFSNYTDIEKHNSLFLENAIDLPFPYDNRVCLKQVYCLVPKVHCYDAEEIYTFTFTSHSKRKKNTSVTQRKM